MRLPKGGLCGGLPGWWFAEAERPWEIRLGKEWCAKCPVLAECRARCDAAEAELAQHHVDPVGVWAGEDGRERAIRRGWERIPGAAEVRGRRRPNGQHAPCGTPAAYNAGCRCFLCSEANRAAQADYVARRRARGAKVEPGRIIGGYVGRRVPRHGTEGRYNSKRYHCRCDRCKAAHSQRMKEYRLALQVKHDLQVRWKGPEFDAAA